MLTAISYWWNIYTHVLKMLCKHWIFSHLTHSMPWFKTWTAVKLRTTVAGNSLRNNLNCVGFFLRNMVLNVFNKSSVYHVFSLNTYWKAAFIWIIIYMNCRERSFQLLKCHIFLRKSCFIFIYTINCNTLNKKYDFTSCFHITRSVVNWNHCVFICQWIFIFVLT